MNFYSHKKLVVSLLGASAAMVVGSVSAAPIGSIAESWHNLGAGNSKATTPNGGTPSNHSNATGEICVFCHTPHGADATASVPIWNRYIAAPPQYTRYSDLGTSTFDAAEAPIGSITIGCLSCHDGTQAMDAVLNAPGSGNWAPAGTAPGRLGGGDFVGADQTNGALIGGDTIVQNLGTDLRNDHPVSMQYGGGGITDAVTPLVTNDPDFIMPIKGTLGTGASVWYIPGEETALRIGGDPYLNATSLNPAGRDRLDIILYSRDEPTVAGGLQPFVECGSCHDPHNVDNPTFLRISNTDPSTAGFEDWAAGNGGPSALCLTCHDK
ncbi:MAG: cytochrome c3 family protein [Gammaproteobacteria bacterium]|nr:cytochrome c3 family protein [Gammaproteobacteria bacterium]